MWKARRGNWIEKVHDRKRGLQGKRNFVWGKKGGKDPDYLDVESKRVRCEQNWKRATKKRVSQPNIGLTRESVLKRGERG